MFNRCLLFMQVCYLSNAECIRSDDRFLLLLPCPRRLVFLCHVLYCKSRLVLSGDVELNPGPLNKSVNTSKGNTSGNRPVTRNAAGSNALDEVTHTPSTSVPVDTGAPSISEMLSKLLEGQTKLAHDIADIKSFQQTVACRFDDLESRVTALERAPKSNEHNSVSEFRSEINCLTSKINELVLKNDVLQNRQGVII